ncbi:Predicted kinase, aminoglycoside phosphotransferase (APT) family [Halomicrobium zhouii]|uniref:Predicted kinase, aminoglycoside phosphotransferase (APT) family n=1 Tax=Halomicrobium zhouii TaxID=767519 RepID=A0A1I6L3A1_9EURY|nr:aminoglycoside phosphotransferase family protein [Halomicrobium zhouii]SFR97924.1 Predicted kinase, aminoglycoside phosphotransferase (APT) family [Halomicrobium zhouii]
MTRDVHDVLESHANSYTVHRVLHDVPPHRVYEVTVDGVRAACKLAREPRATPSIEARVIEHAERETDVPVPNVLTVGDGYFLTEWCDDAPDDQVAVTESGARAMGASLATLHAQTSFQSTGLFGGSDTLAVRSEDTWSETLRERLSAVHDDLAGTGYEDVSERALAFVDDHRTFFDAADDAVLVHGDFVPSHVTFDQDEVSRVVDWEHAIAGPGEYDFARTVLHVFDNPARENERHSEAFRSGYESVRELPAGSDLRRRAYKALIFAFDIRQGYVQDQRPAEELEQFNERFRELAFRIIDDVDEALGGRD